MRPKGAELQDLLPDIDDTQDDDNIDQKKRDTITALNEYSKNIKDQPT